MRHTQADPHDRHTYSRHETMEPIYRLFGEELAGGTRQAVALAADEMVGRLERNGRMPDELFELFEGKTPREAALIYFRGVRQTAELLNQHETALRRLIRLLDRTDRGGTIPWIHNVDTTQDVEALRAIVAAYAEVWNEHTLPIMHELDMA